MKWVPGTSIPIGNIYCVGRNFADHARELKNEIPAGPVVFLKPTSALVSTGDAILLPRQSHRVDHEAEIVVVVGATLKNVTEGEASDSIIGFAAGLDVTARDLQDQAKEKRLPWTVSKGFDTFAAVGPMASRREFRDSEPIRLSLRVNGQIRQSGSTDQMIFSIATLIAYLSSVFTLSRGDLVFTGTPAGVGPLHDGDFCDVTLNEGVARLSIGVKRS